MLRKFLVLLALLLPLQFAWSAASAYCQHETGESQSLHFGHHFHVHKGAHGTPEKPSAASKLGVDADCATCHGGTAAALPSTPVGLARTADPSSLTAAAPPPFTSALARAPDRPQWLRLV